MTESGYMFFWNLGFKYSLRASSSISSGAGTFSPVASSMTNLGSGLGFVIKNTPFDSAKLRGYPSRTYPLFWQSFWFKRHLTASLINSTVNLYPGWAALNSLIFLLISMSLYSSSESVSGFYSGCFFSSSAGTDSAGGCWGTSSGGGSTTFCFFDLED